MADSSSSEVKGKLDDKKKYTKRNTKPSSDYIVRRRCPPHATKRRTDVYVRSSTDFKGQLAHCYKLIDEGETELIIHGLGLAIPGAINLALQVQERMGDAFDVDVATDTVDVVDDLEPLVDDLYSDTRVRPNSCVRIKLFKKDQQEKEG